MNDDWRLEVDLHDARHSLQLLEQLKFPRQQHDLSDAFHDRAIVSRDGPHVFVYAGSREQAEGARRLILSLTEKHGWDAHIDFKRWHPVAEEWEDPDRPLPADEAGKLAEHEALIATERREAEERGYPEFEVRVDLPSRHDAIRFTERLRSEGLPAVRRWRFLLVGASDEDSANALAERLRGEAPGGSRVNVEGAWKLAYAERPQSPFAVLGGLGG